jgi:hypothetical protein
MGGGRSDGGSGRVTDRCRQERTAALRRLIEDAEASGITDCSVDEILAEARALPNERRREAESADEGRTGVRSPTDRKA